MAADSSANSLPRHIAIIMDGNGRWARSRMLPRYVGHREGVKSVRRVVEGCIDRNVPALTLFAFSSENWRRPSEEVGLIMDLFVNTLKKEVGALDRNGVRLRFIGDRTAFADKLRRLIEDAEQQTRDNTKLELAIAANCTGPVYPHWWRAAHQQLFAVAAGLYRTLFYRCPVAGVRRARAGCSTALVCQPAAPFRAYRRPGGATQGCLRHG
jgi:hypothetical protein